MKRFGEYCFLLRDGMRRYESGGEACAIATVAPGAASQITLLSSDESRT